MTQGQQNQDRFQAHLDAMEKHRQLLATLHLDGNDRLDELNETFAEMTVTFEEYLKLIGIP